MVRHKRLIHRDQRGITLIEMLVVVALIGIIAAGIAMTISQVLAVNSRTSSKMVALRQVQQAGDRVSKDVLQAQNVTREGECGLPLTLSIPYWTHNATGGLEMSQYTVEYWLDGDELRRKYDDGTSDPITTTVAQYIVTDCDNTKFVPAESGYIFKVTARVGTQTESREYKIEPRPDP